MSQISFSRNYLPAIVNYTGDITFNYAGSGGTNFDIELGPTLSRFRVLTSIGASLFSVNDSGWLQIFNSTAPGTNPTLSGYLYVESGALKYRGSAGTITTLGAA